MNFGNKICIFFCFFFRDRSDVTDTDHRPFFADGGYKVYGINKQLVPRKLSLSFDIKTFDENSLIYLAITVSHIFCAFPKKITNIFNIQIFLGRLSAKYHSVFGKWIC